MSSYAWDNRPPLPEFPPDPRTQGLIEELANQAIETGESARGHGWIVVTHEVWETYREMTGHDWQVRLHSKDGTVYLLRDPDA